MVEAKKEFTFTIPQVRSIAIDVGTVSPKALERAQVLCLVVSAELGVEAQTRDCIAMAAKYMSKTAAFVSKVDAVDDGERDATVATILESVEQELSSHDDFDATQSVAGSVSGPDK